MQDTRRYDPEEDAIPEPAPVRRLRLMVSALLFVLIAGVVTVVATLVIRLGAVGPAPEPAAIAAGSLTLPAGEAITAIGQAGSTLLVTTRDEAGAERLRAFSAATGEALSETRIERE